MSSSTSSAFSFEEPSHVVPPAELLTVAFSIFPDVSGSSIKASTWPWERIVQYIASPTKEFASKQDCPLIKLATFGQQRTEKGSLRHDANVLKVTGLEGDYDAGEVRINEAAMLLSDAGITAVIYTSPSHTEQAPRWRVLCPLSHPSPRGSERICWPG